MDLNPSFTLPEHKPTLHRVITNIQQSIEQQPQDSSWSVLLQKKYLIIGMGLNAFQQFSGVNVVIYYAATIFTKAGFSKSNASLMTAAIGVPQLIMVFLSLYFLIFFSGDLRTVLDRSIWSKTHVVHWSVWHVSRTDSLGLQFFRPSQHPLHTRRSPG